MKANSANQPTSGDIAPASTTASANAVHACALEPVTAFNTAVGATANGYRYDLNAPGFFSLDVVLEIVPIGRSKWYEGQKLGVYPKPVPLGVGRRRAYRRSDIKALVQRLEAGRG